jgi:DNA-binding MarR family transcriptional regulator
MDNFEDHPVFASDETLLQPLSSNEIRELRVLLQREQKGLRDASSQDFTQGVEQRIDHTMLAERIYQARRHRDRVFDDSLFADPAWDLMLYLFIRSQHAEQVSVSSACHAAGVPEATALRYLKTLTERGYTERSNHAHDRRVTNVKISNLGNRRMIEWLDGFAPER